MNVALLIDRPKANDFPGYEMGPVLLGMPHLALNGLSETWLLKELGHRHWLLLARMAGRKVPDFIDHQGNTVYAAFRSVKIVGTTFHRARENDLLHIRTSLARISRTQVRSSHELLIDNTSIGVVTMISVFVHRRGSSSNHSVARVEISGLPPIQSSPVRPPSRPPANRPPFDIGRPHACLLYTPCPSQDFNGAGFLYFTNFVAFSDRVEWAVNPIFARDATTVQREIAYHANLDPGETIAVRLVGSGYDATGWHHHCRIDRTSDGVALADIWTVKRYHSG
jgi:probable biosynthetic protein (TIGR04099 family)